MKCNYYWYHHMAMSGEEMKEINKVIEEHNFEEFLKYYKKYNSLGLKDGFIDDTHEFSKKRVFCPIIFFPDYAFMYREDEEDSDVEIDILDEENFYKITHSECECG